MVFYNSQKITLLKIKMMGHKRRIQELGSMDAG
jgi:hypothetical protein